MRSGRLDGDLGFGRLGWQLRGVGVGDVVHSLLVAVTIKVTVALAKLRALSGG
jgi:hypothetical protein